MENFSNPRAQEVAPEAAKQSWLLIFLMAACSLAGCTRSKISSDTLVVLTDMKPASLDPLTATDAAAQKVIDLVHGALVRLGPQMQVLPELAESWRIDGYRRFHFKLRQGLRFQDGASLTAQDVVQSLDETRAKSVNAVAFSGISKISAHAPDQVVIETSRPQPFLLSDLAAAKIFKRGPAGNLVTSGRFRVESSSTLEVRLVRSDVFPKDADEAGALPRARTIAFRFVRDEITRYQLLMRGDANVAWNAFTVARTSHLRSVLPSKLRLVNAAGVPASYLCMNFRDPKLAVKKVRQAIAHAIDVDSILKYRFQDFGYRSTGLLAPSHGDYYEPNVKRYAYDPATAERLLDEAGFRRPRPGAFRFSLTYKTTFDKTGYDTALILADMLRKVGIDVRLQVVELGTFFADVKAGNFQLFSSRWIGITNPSIYFRVFHSSQIGSLNRGAYANAAMDRLLDRGVSESNDKVRREIFSQVQKLAAEDLPYVPLWHWNNTFIGTKQMSHIQMYPSASYMTLSELTLEPQK